MCDVGTVTGSCEVHVKGEHSLHWRKCLIVDRKYDKYDISSELIKFSRTHPERYVEVREMNFRTNSMLLRTTNNKSFLVFENHLDKVPILKLV